MDYHKYISFKLNKTKKNTSNCKFSHLSVDFVVLFDTKL